MKRWFDSLTAWSTFAMPLLTAATIVAGLIASHVHLADGLAAVQGKTADLASAQQKSEETMANLKTDTAVIRNDVGWIRHSLEQPKAQLVEPDKVAAP